ncbi:FAD-dependent oxidoreductase, partial [Pseudomonas aeruginosa]
DSSEPVVYFIGLPLLSRSVSSFIEGVCHVALHDAYHIANNRQYLSYPDPAHRHDHDRASQVPQISQQRLS